MSFLSPSLVASPDRTAKWTDWTDHWLWIARRMVLIQPLQGRGFLGGDYPGYRVGLGGQPLYSHSGPIHRLARREEHNMGVL
jgi:hypothetical protein